MARGDIRAGRAFVELTIRNSAFVKGLRNAQQRLQSFGAGIAAIGGAMSGAGAAILAPLTGAVVKFAAIGDQLGKMSARTGVAVGALAELGFAAEQSGTDLETVGNVIQRMNRRLGRAATIGGEAKTAMEELGLSIEAMQSMNPEERFMAIADAMNQYGDDAAAAGLAQRAFGAQVDKLLPLIRQGADGIEALRKEARDLGLSPSPESVAAAEQVTDAMNRIRQAVKATVFEIGHALAPAVLTALDAIKGIVVTAQRWIKQNKDLVRTVAAVGVGLVAAGAAVTGLGVAIFATGSILGAMATVLTTVGAVAGALASPFGIAAVAAAALAAAVGGGVVAWVKFTDSGRRAFSIVKDTFGRILQTARDTFGGVFDAIAGGDLQLAGKIATTGLKIAVLEGIKGAADLITGVWGDTVSDIASKISGGDFKGAWNTAVKAMSAVWDKFSEEIVNTFTGAAKNLVKLWQNATTQIANSILDLASDEGLVGDILDKLLGIDLSAELALNEKLNRQARQRGLGETDIDEILRKGVDANISKTADAITGFLDEMDKSAQDEAEKSKKEHKEEVAGAGDELVALIASLNADMAALRAEAAAKRAAAQVPGGDEDEPGLGGAAAAGGVAVSFSAAALSALGGGGVQERIARGVEAQNALLKQQLKMDEKIIRAVENMGVKFE